VTNHLVEVILWSEQRGAWVTLVIENLASTWKLGQRCSWNGKLGRPAEYKHVLKKQVENCPTSMAKGVIVRIVAINVQQSSMDCTVH
jgi:hypothetical protein